MTTTFERRAKPCAKDRNGVFVGHETTYLANDGLHVTPAGNQILSQLFFQALSQALNK